MAMRKETKEAFEKMEAYIGETYCKNEWEKIALKANITFETFLRWATLKRVIIRNKISLKEAVELLNKSTEEGYNYGSSEWYELIDNTLYKCENAYKWIGMKE